MQNLVVKYLLIKYFCPSKLFGQPLNPFFTHFNTQVQIVHSLAIIFCVLKKNIALTVTKCSVYCLFDNN